MGKSENLTLNEIGDIIFESAQSFLFTKREDTGVEFFIQKSKIQELMTLKFMDNSRVLLKLYPHKNYVNNLVYRIEVYRTKEGDLRGNRIAFLEASNKKDSQEEVTNFIENLLTQLQL